jgi:ribosomal protein L32
VDPEQGKSSPWKRGVRREHQVLICPDCVADAHGELDHCSGCGSTHLIRRLDQVECLACGLARDANPDSGAGPGREAGTEPSPSSATAPPSSPSLSPSSRREPRPPRPATLADEVASALDRVLGRG